MQVHNVKKCALSAALGLTMTLASTVTAADVVVVVSSKSNVSTLSTDQIGQIFLAKSVFFPNGEQAIPVDQSDTELRNEFYKKITGKDQNQLKAYWSQLLFTGKAKPPKSVSDSAEVKKMLSDNPNMIGYISKGSVDPSVKVVLAP